MLNNNEIQFLEKKYFDILSDLFDRNLGEIITQIYSQESIITPSTTAKSNTIEHSVENIVEGIIFSQLGWKVCSLPVSSDSCFEVGNAIINIDDDTERLDFETIIEGDKSIINGGYVSEEDE